MAFNADNLVRIGGGSGTAIWKYTTTDTQADVNTVGYFNQAVKMINLHDIIFVAADTDGTPSVFYAYVNANNGVAMDIVDGVVVTVTDSD